MGKAVKLKLGDDFSIPAYKAGLDVLLLLAETIDEMFSLPGIMDLFDRSESGNWMELVQLLGRLNVEPQSRVSEAAKIGDLWNIFFLQGDARNLERELIVVLKDASKKSIARAKSGKPSLNYLDTANGYAFQLVTDLLKRHGASHLVPANRSNLELFYDGAGKEYCAGSSRWTNSIRWGYQAVPHALLGALIAEFVFAHEYLSHILPQNKYLDSTIREQWLVAALRGAMQEDKSRPYWKKRVWAPYRAALESHVVAFARTVQPDASTVRYSGYEGAEEMLWVLCLQAPALFWRLTVELLGSKDDEELAEYATQVAKGLVCNGLPDLNGHKILNIKDLAVIVDP